MKKHPVLISIDTTELPVQEIPFPTVTLCHYQMPRADRTNYFARYLDHIKFRCKGRHNCHTNIELRNKLRPALKQVVKRQQGKIYFGHTKKATFDELVEATNSYRSYREIWNKVMELDTPGSIQFFSTFKDLIIDNALKHESNYFLRKPLYEETENCSKLAPNMTFESVDDCVLDFTCRNTKMMQWHSYMLTMDYFMNENMPSLGTYFKEEGLEMLLKPYTWPGDSETKKLVITSSVDWLSWNQYLDEIFTCMTKGNIQNISLLDVPTMLAPTDITELDILRMNLPFHHRITYSADMSTECNEAEYNIYLFRWFMFLASKEDLAKFGFNVTKMNNPCPVKGEAMSPCCNHFPAILMSELETVLKIMRYSQDMAKALETYEHQLKNLGPLECLNATLKTPENTYGYGGPFMMNPDNFIPSCVLIEDKRGRVLHPHCQKLEPLISTRGVCQVFNGRSNVEIYKNSKFMKLFNDVFNVPMKSNVQKTLGVGSRYAPTFLIDMGHRKENQLTRSVAYSAVNTAIDAFEMHSKVYPILAGYHTTLKVWPSAIVAEKGTWGMDVKERKCRFNHEFEG